MKFLDFRRKKKKGETEGLDKEERMKIIKLLEEANERPFQTKGTEYLFWEKGHQLQDPFAWMYNIDARFNYLYQISDEKEVYISSQDILMDYLRDTLLRELQALDGELYKKLDAEGVIDTLDTKGPLGLRVFQLPTGKIWNEKTLKEYLKKVNKKLEENVKSLPSKVSDEFKRVLRGLYKDLLEAIEKHAKRVVEANRKYKTRIEYTIPEWDNGYSTQLRFSIDPEKIDEEEYCDYVKIHMKAFIYSVPPFHANNLNKDAVK